MDTCERRWAEALALASDIARYKYDQNGATQPLQSMQPIVGSSRHGSQDVPHGPAVSVAAGVVDEVGLPIEPTPWNSYIVMWIWHREHSR